MQGWWARTMMKTCWKWERMFWGVKGNAPGSWKMMVTMSLPMCLFLSSYKRHEEGQMDPRWPEKGVGMPHAGAGRYLLPVVGGVGQHGGDVEHDLVVLVGRVERVGAGGVS